MSSETGADAAPAAVADLATRPEILDTGEIALIGLAGGARGYRALLRLPGGRVRRVAPGDRVGWGRVTAIDENGLLFRRNGATRRLTLPGG